jgi:hypothetical protein
MASAAVALRIFPRFLGISEDNIILSGRKALE